MIQILRCVRQFGESSPRGRIGVYNEEQVGTPLGIQKATKQIPEKNSNPLYATLNPARTALIL